MVVSLIVVRVIFNQFLSIFILVTKQIKMITLINEDVCKNAMNQSEFSSRREEMRVNKLR